MVGGEGGRGHACMQRVGGLHAVEGQGQQSEGWWRARAAEGMHMPKGQEGAGQNQDRAMRAQMGP